VAGRSKNAASVSSGSPSNSFMGSIITDTDQPSEQARLTSTLQAENVDLDEEEEFERA